MLKRVLILFVVALIALQADEPSNQKTKKHTLTICALFKNESSYIKEWLTYHQLIGVDHFVLYDNNSNDRTRTVLQPYINKGIVTLLSWPDALSPSQKEDGVMWSLSTLLPAYENARLKMKDETKWLVCLDVEEFLVTAEGTTLPELLKKYENYPAVVLGKECFDASKTEAVPKRKLVIETVEMVASEENPLKTIENTIFQPEYCESFVYPNYKYVYKNKKKSAKVSKQEMHVNRYQNRFKGKLHFGKNREKLQVDKKMMSEDEIQNLLDRGYEIEDRDPAVQHYVAEMLRRLRY